MPDWLKSALQFVKLPAWLLLTITTVAAFALFAPDAWANALGLQVLRANWRPWVGVAFLGSGLGVAYRFTEQRLHGAERARLRDQRRAHLLEQLQHLTHHEKRILRAYVEQRVRVMYQGVNDTAASGLRSLHLLVRAEGEPYGVLGNFPHRVHPAAWDHLLAHPELVTPEPGEGPPNKPGPVAGLQVGKRT